MEPPPSWWVLTYHTYARSWNQLYTLGGTNVHAHLFMAWATHKPARQPIYKTIRGKSILCGYRYVWDTPNIEEQREPGDTPYHSWHLKYLESDDHIWYYLFSPEGPYDLECQGPLIHVPPPEVYLWSEYMLIGTREKGVFYTYTFSGPGGPPPVWRTANGGLLSLQIVQMCPDPLGVWFRQYCIAGLLANRVLYRRIPPVSPAWIPTLTTPQAQALTGTTSGHLRWVSTNINHPACLYVLFTGVIADERNVFLIRSPDYGATWTTHEIYMGNAYNAGNLQIGILQGSSPYPPGDVLYATVNHRLGGRTYIYRSFDNGLTWSFGDFTGITLAIGRCCVDPTDQSIVYMGGFGLGNFPRRLFRSASHGDVWVNISNEKKLGIFITPYPANLWIDPTNHQFLRVLQDNHIWTTPDSGLTWDDWGAVQIRVARHTANWDHPDRLYLAKHTSGAFPPVGPPNHVIFVSDTHGIYMEGKAGEHPYFEDGGGDSIPWNCGGVCLQGMMLFPP